MGSEASRGVQTPGAGHRFDRGRARSGQSSRSTLAVLLGLTMLAAISTCALVAGCGDDAVKPPAPPKVPGSWAGIWAARLVQHDCGDTITTYAISFQDTIFAGNLVEEELDFGAWIGTQCAGTYTITDTTVAYACGADFQSSNCRMEFRMNGNGRHFQATDSFTATLSVRKTNTPPLCFDGEPDLCTELVLEGHRVAAAPPGCGSSRTGFIGKAAILLRSAKGAL